VEGIFLQWWVLDRDSPVALVAALVERAQLRVRAVSYVRSIGRQNQITKVASVLGVIAPLVNTTTSTAEGELSLAANLALMCVFFKDAAFRRRRNTESRYTNRLN